MRKSVVLLTPLLVLGCIYLISLLTRWNITKGLLWFYENRVWFLPRPPHMQLSETDRIPISFWENDWKGQSHRSLESSTFEADTGLWFQTLHLEDCDWTGVALQLALGHLGIQSYDNCSFILQRLALSVGAVYIWDSTPATSRWGLIAAAFNSEGLHMIFGDVWFHLAGTSAFFFNILPLLG